MTRQALRSKTLLILGISALSWGCAPATRQGPQDPLAATLTRLRAQEAAGAVASVHGHQFFVGPDAATKFTDSPVSLIPLSPDLEAAVARAGQEYDAGRRAPLSPEATRARWALLDRHVAAIKRRGFGSLIRVTTTDPKEARFEFSGVPAGPWLLVGVAPSPVSVVYWAVPLKLEPGVSIRQHLSDSNIWLEGLR